MATTQGYVLRITWSTDPLTCFAVGSSLTSAKELFVRAHSMDTRTVIDSKMSLVAFLTNAQMSGCVVDVTHEDTSDEVTAADIVLADTVAYPLQLDDIEVTQSIQDLKHSVTLIAGKRTVVRVYLSCYSAMPVNVTGTISVRSLPSDPPTFIPLQQTVAVFPAEAGDVVAKRNDAAKSLNFVLPPEWTAAGSLSIAIDAIIDTDTSAIIPVGGLITRVVQFQDSPPLRVKILCMKYTLEGSSVPYVASDFQVNMLLSWLCRAYPVAQVISSVAVMNVDDPVPNPGLINAQLDQARTLDLDSCRVDERTHYYGCVDDGGYWMRGSETGSYPKVASGPIGQYRAKWMWDIDGSYGDWYGGHELAHTYGRLHPGCCGQSKDDNLYPYPEGQIGPDDDSLVGFDVGDPTLDLPLAAMPGSLWHDVMTYCDRLWISDYTYKGIRAQIVTEDSAPGGCGADAVGGETLGGGLDEGLPEIAAPQLGGPFENGKRLVSVVGIVNLTKKQGRIRYVNPLREGRESGTVRKSATVLRAVNDVFGSTLSEHPIRVNPDSDAPADDRDRLFSAVIPLDERTRSIELLIEGERADWVSVGGSPPKPTTVRVVQHDSEAHEIYLVVDGENLDEGNYRYVVQVHTKRYTWQTVAVGLTKPHFSIDSSQFEPLEPVEVRVLVTNGLQTSDVISDTFIVSSLKTASNYGSGSDTV